MGQYWNIICLDKHETTGHLGKLGELILWESSRWQGYDYKYNNTPQWIETVLTIGKFPDLIPLSAKPTENYETKIFSHLEYLPYDLIHRIFLELESINDILRLSLACYRLLIFGQRFIKVKAEALMAPWANKRIICLGDYAYGTLPKGMLTPVEAKGPAGKDLFDYSHSFSMPTRSICLRPVYSDVTQSANLHKIIDELLGYGRIDMPAMADAVLRNKTLRIYVRGSRVPCKNKKLCLGVLMILRMCWTADNSITLSYQRRGLQTGPWADLEEGPWAGHRFDIVRADEIDSSWTDVSDETIARFRQIIEEDFNEVVE